MHQVKLEYDDGREAVIKREISSLLDAVSFALDLADRAGKFLGDGHGAPKYVKIYRGGLIELSIAVVHGGLLTAADELRSRST